MTVTDAGAAGCQFASADPASPANVADNYSGPTDWRGLWFKLDKEKGEFIGMRAGRPRADGGVDWRFLPHLQHDGLGGFKEILKADGFGVGPLPTLNETRRPNLRKRAAALWRHFFKPPVTAAAWQTLDPQWKPQPGLPVAGTAIATLSIDKDRTQRLARAAKQHRVSLNSLLLSALARASEADLGPGPALWVIPVNMRGAVKTSRESANHGSYLDLELRRGATAREVHEKIKAGFHNLEHWGAWAMLNAGRVVGYDGMRRIQHEQLARRQGRPWVGTFTNLGAWNGIGDWYVCTPVTYSCPLGAAVITCDGKMMVMIEAHPSIARDQSLPRALIARWMDQLDIAISG